jgi:hypothetical protein
MDLTASLVGSSYTSKKVSENSFFLDGPSLDIDVVVCSGHTIYHSPFLVRLFNRHEKLRLLPNTIATSVEIKSTPVGAITKIDGFYIVAVNYFGPNLPTNVCYNFDSTKVTKSVMVAGKWIELPCVKLELFQTDDYIMIVEK